MPYSNRWHIGISQQPRAPCKQAPHQLELTSLILCGHLFFVFVLFFSRDCLNQKKMTPIRSSIDICQQWCIQTVMQTTRITMWITRMDWWVLACSQKQHLKIFSLLLLIIMHIQFLLWWSIHTKSLMAHNAILCNRIGRRGIVIVILE